MTVKNITNDLLKNFGGVKKNDLNSVLELKNLNDDHTDTFNASEYYDFDLLVDTLKPTGGRFSTLSLNIESINAKFNQLISFIEALDQNECYIDAFLIQETWLSKEQCNSVFINQFHIPGYHTIPLGKECGRKGGLMIYLRDIFNYSMRNLYTSSLHWEGLFIDITHKDNELLPNKISLANVYRPPRDNNSNKSIDRFLEPFSEIFKILCRENSTLITGGDFNIDLLKLTEREKFQEYFDLFVSNGSIPQITLPTRFSKKKMLPLLIKFFVDFLNQQAKTHPVL